MKRQLKKKLDKVGNQQDSYQRRNVSTDKKSKIGARGKYPKKFTTKTVRTKEKSSTK